MVANDIQDVPEKMHFFSLIPPLPHQTRPWRSRSGRRRRRRSGRPRPPPPPRTDTASSDHPVITREAWYVKR